MLQTQTITISDVTNSRRGVLVYRDTPLCHSETKTITYESAQVTVLPQTVVHMCLGCDGGSPASPTNLQLLPHQPAACLLSPVSVLSNHLCLSQSGDVQPEKDSAALLSAQTVTSETISTTTTTQITKVCSALVLPVKEPRSGWVRGCESGCTVRLGGLLATRWR